MSPRAQSTGQSDLAATKLMLKRSGYRRVRFSVMTVPEFTEESLSTSPPKDSARSYMVVRFRSCPLLILNGHLGRLRAISFFARTHHRRRYRGAPHDWSRPPRIRI